MAARVYATAEQYAEFAEEAFDGDNTLLLKRLRSASVELEKLTRAARYVVDDDGLPTDTATAAAFAEAACAIVEHWEDTGDPRGTDAVQGAVKIGSVSLGTTSSSSEGLTAREKLERRIGDKAVDILTNAGLIGSAISHT